MSQIAGIIDANVILRPEGLDLSEKYFVTPQVKNEVKSRQGSLNFAAIDFEVREPSGEFLKEVRAEAEDLNSKVSKEDLSIAALALEHSLKVYTDDLDLQNLCSFLAIEFEGIYRSIDEEREWVLKCPTCGSRMEHTDCDSCGFSGDPERKPID